MSRFGLFRTPIAGLSRLVSRQLGDQRGHLSRVFCAEELTQVGWKGIVAQANLTYTRQKGTVRGLHFQYPPHAEVKMVRCLRGEIWDVAVDLRKDSPTFLKWHAEVLSPDNLSALLIPQGCAHGFQSLTDDVEMLYLHSAAHAPASEGGLSVNDPLLSIEWPLTIGEMSARDRSFPFLPHDFKGISLP
jgi:dTDP-4-dehydrorhamnose 3,5-epimerase